MGGSQTKNPIEEQEPPIVSPRKSLIGVVPIVNSPSKKQEQKSRKKHINVNDLLELSNQLGQPLERIEYISNQLERRGVYIEKGLLGEGGSGYILKAFNDRDEKLAIKFVKCETEDQVKSSLMEYKILRQFNSEYVTKVKELLQVEKEKETYHVIVMERCACKNYGDIYQKKYFITRKKLILTSLILKMQLKLILKQIQKIFQIIMEDKVGYQFFGVEWIQQIFLLIIERRQFKFIQFYIKLLNQQFTLHFFESFLGDLKQFLLEVKDNHSVLSKKFVVDVCTQLAEGLNILHSKNIIHLDIKPANLLYGYDKKWKYGKQKISSQLQLHQFVIADLGISKTLSNEKQHTNHLNGYTACYSSPEQFQMMAYNAKKKVTKASDVYSLGIVFLEITGVEINKKWLIAQKLQQKKKDTQFFNPEFDEFNQSVILPMLTYNPDKRIDLFSLIEILKGLNENDDTKRILLQPLPTILPNTAPPQSQVIIPIESQKPVSSLPKERPQQLSSQKLKKLPQRYNSLHDLNDQALIQAIEKNKQQQKQQDQQQHLQSPNRIQQQLQQQYAYQEQVLQQQQQQQQQLQQQQRASQQYLQMIPIKQIHDNQQLESNRNFYQTPSKQLSSSQVASSNLSPSKSNKKYVNTDPSQEEESPIISSRQRYMYAQKYQDEEDKKKIIKLQHVRSNSQVKLLPPLLQQHSSHPSLDLQSRNSVHEPTPAQNNLSQRDYNDFSSALYNNHHAQPQLHPSYQNQQGSAQFNIQSNGNGNLFSYMNRPLQSNSINSVSTNANTNANNINISPKPANSEQKDSNYYQVKNKRYGSLSQANLDRQGINKLISMNQEFIMPSKQSPKIKQQGEEDRLPSITPLKKRSFHRQSNDYNIPQPYLPTKEQKSVSPYNRFSQNN